ncbi:MAG: aspartate-semialdehyde dehydrogenase [Candidatus Neomarinimicrobiota bacterium]|nr:aspartate-semialdehyde dehydrogenase [Candidatus Neomarinimicrobiota bacterium]MDX9779702.1 aspartate-semialdehyde dehydrogenase [bacterium]
MLKIKEKIPVGILGATGSVGQKFVELLQDHPWFRITALAASERSEGKLYRHAVNWFQKTPLAPRIGIMPVSACLPKLPCRIVFSGLDAEIAGPVEKSFAKAGYVVISNAKNHRMEEDVPLLIPEVNPEHLVLIEKQGSRGKLITNPNCSTIGLAMALKPLQDAFGLEKVSVVTLQALSGAGYPGVSSLDIIDNVIPYIGGEEEKIQIETLKILGSCKDGKVDFADIIVSAQCNRVAVIDGHSESVAVKLKQRCKKEDMIAAWREFRAEPQKLALPSAPDMPLMYFDEAAYPQPKLHRDLGGGMTVSIGRLRDCSVLDYKFTVLSHNTIRGAAGCAILNAELLVKKGYLDEH